MQVTVIVLTYNGTDYLAGCLESLQPLPANVQLLVVDNGSSDDSVAVACAAAPEAMIVESGHNFGFSGGMNRGMQIAMGDVRCDGADIRPADIVVLLNQDTRILPGWHQAIVAPFDDPAVAAVGCKIYAADQTTILHVGAGLDERRGVSFHIGEGETDQGQYEEMVTVQFATGAALALRTSILRQVGLFDERYNPGYMEEVDLCHRIWRAGYRVVVNPAARLIHYEGTSTPDLGLRSFWFNRGRLLFLIKTRPLQTILTEFREAEQAYLQTSNARQDCRALKRAYLDAILRLPDWFMARAIERGESSDEQEYEQLLDLLGTLRNQCVTTHDTALDLQFE